MTPLPEYEAALHDGVEWLCLQAATGEGRLGKHRVVAWKGTEDAPIATLGPGTPQDLVATFKGWDVYAAKEDLLEPEETWQDLGGWIGFSVVGEDGVELGTVAQCFATAQNAAVQVERANGKHFSFPVIEETVRAVDLEKGEVTVGDLTPYRVDDED